MALEGFHVPINAPWYPDLRAEMMAFPAGKHDDQVDALGLVGQLLDKDGRRSKLPGDVVKHKEKIRKGVHRAEHQPVNWRTV